MTDTITEVITEDTVIEPTTEHYGDGKEAPNLEVVEFPRDIGDVPKALQRLGKDLEEQKDFSAVKAIVIVVDENEAVGMWGFGQVGGLHSTLGILEHAKLGISIPRQPEM